MRTNRYFVVVASTILFLAACGSGDTPSSAGSSPSDEQTPVDEETDVEEIAEEETSACLGKKKGPIVKVLAGKPDDTGTGFDSLRFHPDKLELPAGKFVTLKVVHGAGQSHTFTIDALDCDTGTLAAGDVAFVSFKVPKGTTEFHCIPHEMGGMDGKIIGT